ncbi:MAG TPA: TrkA family potassium uptake protein [Dehalococcoidia bacterium]|nr:TrkA family potassium uptake protein [Dehalococcoidia bacterium]
MTKQIAVIGLGRFGVSVASTLCALGNDVLVIDRSESKIQNISQDVTHAVQADATNETVLKELGLSNFEMAIVAIGTDIKSSVLSTILLKKLGIPHVIARANDDLHGSILERIGADIVTYPEREMGIKIAQGVTLAEVSDYMSVVAGYGVAKLAAPPYLVGEKLSDLGFGYKERWEVAVFLIQRGDEVIVTPTPGQKIEAGDILVLAGSNEKLEKLLAEARKNKKEE